MQFSEEMFGREQELMTTLQISAERSGLWAVILKLQPKLDGDQWCILWGEDMQNGVAAFGNSPEEAMWAFEKEMSKKLPNINPWPDPETTNQKGE